jgi:hypothetical protein
VAVFLVAAFLAGKAFATVNCFTDTVGNWAETEICWLKDHGVASGYGGGLYGPNDHITRAEMAVMLRNQAEVPPDTGLTTITPGNGEWMKWRSIDDITFENYSSSTDVKKATAGETYLAIQPSIPTVLYGRKMQLVGVEFCFQATADTYLSYVEVNTFTSATGDASRTVRYSDSTDRTDMGCKYYQLATAYTLNKQDGVNFFISVHWNAGGTAFTITRTTFVLQPTDTMAAPYTAPSYTGEVVLLSETDATAQVPGTSAP